MWKQDHYIKTEKLQEIVYKVKSADENDDVKDLHRIEILDKKKNPKMIWTFVKSLT